MKKFYIPEVFIDVIKNQALSSENEIYGWLIGYIKEDTPHILAIFECKRFVHQSLISAIPQAEEFQEISSVLPQGIGPIGIYHSHPASGAVFHSHTDDSTLISLSNQFPNCVSIVTNGTEINYYQMGKSRKTKEIIVEYEEPEVVSFILISINEHLTIQISKSMISKNENESRLKIKILNLIRPYLEKAWNKLVLYSKNKEISEKEKIKKYLVSDLDKYFIQLKIPEEFKSKNEKLLTINDQSNEEKEFIEFNLNLKARIPIYITEEDKTIDDLNEIIKTELISNNLLQKIFTCSLNYENEEIVIPDENYLNFFGFLIKILAFKSKELNQGNLSKKSFEFISKMISQFNSFKNKEISKKLKEKIEIFLKDVKNTSRLFDWNEKLLNSIEELKKNLRI